MNWRFRALGELRVCEIKGSQYNRAAPTGPRGSTWPVWETMDALGTARPATEGFKTNRLVDGSSPLSSKRDALKEAEMDRGNREFQNEAGRWIAELVRRMEYGQLDWHPRQPYTRLLLREKAETLVERRRSRLGLPDFEMAADLAIETAKVLISRHRSDEAVELLCHVFVVQLKQSSPSRRWLNEILDALALVICDDEKRSALPLVELRLSRALEHHERRYVSEPAPRVTPTKPAKAAKAAKAASNHIQEFSWAARSEAQKLSDEAERLLDRGDFAGAEKALLRRLKVRIKLFGREQPDVASDLTQLADLALRQGKYAKAEDRCEAALRILTKHSGPTDSEIAIPLSLQGSILLIQGEFERAEDCFRRALKINKQYFLAGLPTARSHYNLGRALLQRGLHAKARDQFHSAQEIQQKHDPNHLELAQTLDLLGRTLAEQQDPDLAEMHYERALKIKRGRLPLDDPQIATSLNNLALLAQDRGDLHRAEQLHRDVLRITTSRRGKEHPDVATSQFNLAILLTWRGVFGEAEELLDSSLGIVESWRTSVVGDELSRSRASMASGMDLMARALAQIRHVRGDPEGALDAAERGQARALLDLLARRERDLVSEAQSSVSADKAKRLARAQERVRRARESETKAGAACDVLYDRPDFYSEAVQGDFEKRKQAARKSQAALRKAERDLNRMLQTVWPVAKPADVKDICSALQPGESLLVYVQLQDKLLLILARPEAEGPVIESYMAVARADQFARLQERISLLKTKFSREGNARSGAALPAEAHEEWVNASHEVFRDILPARVRQKLVGATRVILVQDGILTGLPFEALVTDVGSDLDSVRYWIDEGPEIVYASSAAAYREHLQSVEPRLRKAAPAGLNAVVLGDPVYEPRRARAAGMAADSDDAEVQHATRAQEESLRHFPLDGGRPRRLPATAEEARAIAEAIREVGGDVRLLLGEEATVSAVWQSAPGRHFVHLATHGYMGSSERPYDARLALSPPSRLSAQDNGFLTLDDMLGRWQGKLSDCELAVLSACDTQRSQNVGDSAVALPWGFIYSGASAVIASLWQVSDTSTRELMVEFYKLLLENLGQDKVSIFTKARRKLKEKYPEPYHWAPFIYLGSPR